jgi:hypothetical protein
VSVLLGLAAVGLPLLAQHTIDRRAEAVVEAVLRGDARQQAEAIAHLKPFGLLVGRRGARRVWHTITDADMQERLHRAWYEATGQGLADSD